MRFKLNICLQNYAVAFWFCNYDIIIKSGIRNGGKPNGVKCFLKKYSYFYCVFKRFVNVLKHKVSSNYKGPFSFVSLINDSN